jgi:signal transduction histidine kinase/DNA-binding response OmpR family regulator
MTSSDKVNILVVDDLADKLLVLQSVLEELGENVVTADSGREALRQLLDRDFAVILLDVHMPIMDGFETAAMIRQRKRSRHTPIIFITAFNDEMHTAQGYSLGAVDYIPSPVVPEILRTKVRVFVDLFRMTEQVKRRAEEHIALARAEAARAAAEEATRRSTFLAEASRVLASSLDYEATLRGLSRLALPFLGDLSALTLLDSSGCPGPTEWAWVDPAGASGAASTTGTEGLPAPLAEALGRVLATGTTEFLPQIDPEFAAVPEANCPHGPLTSAVVMPLVARGRTLGALSLAMSHSGRRYGLADLTLAEDLASRAAVALDNARLYREVQEADRRKNEFLAMLAHELRNPLAPIRNAVHILRACGPDPTRLPGVRDMIERQVEHLVRLVDDLLDVSRITGGKIRLQMERVEMADVVAHALETSRPLLDARRHQLTVSPPSEPLPVHGDPVRLAQVLGNLLNNAAKYTEEGGRVWLSAAREGSAIVLRVRDTGVGIPPEMLASIFDLFTQVDRSLDRSQGGLGIGLTLVRRLVEMHGGSVQASSPGPGQGSEFVVRLPALVKQHAIQTPSNGQSEHPVFCRRRILIVDDNVDAAESLMLVLQRQGHDVRAAQSGQTALKTAADFAPQVVLLDLGLPGMDGFEVARRLRQKADAEPPLLLALTGYGRDEDRRRSREVGFDQHLIKPVDLDLLAALMAGLPVPSVAAPTAGRC